jgi:hypothetical protein
LGAQQLPQSETDPTRVNEIFRQLAKAMPSSCTTLPKNITSRPRGSIDHRMRPLGCAAVPELTIFAYINLNS